MAITPYEANFLVLGEKKPTPKAISITPETVLINSGSGSQSGIKG